MIHADARRLPLAVESVHMVATSPPYFGLRDYGGDPRQVGLEQLHDCLGWARGARLCQGDSAADCYVCTLRAVARELWRVLRDDGVMWLNIGDSYAGSSMSGGVGSGTIQGTQQGATKGCDLRFARSRETALRPKSLLGVPWRVALALQADGWILRSDIIWAKPNPMPESVRDRCTKSHEHVFMLAKSPRYYFDADAIREEAAGRNHHDLTGGRYSPEGQTPHTGSRESTASAGGRNRRDVWRIATKGYSGAHFAAWPPALVEPMILAGCPPGGWVLDPFAGSGTTGMVAVQHRRSAVLVDCNRDYLAEQATRRTSNIQMSLLSA